MTNGAVPCPNGCGASFNTALALMIHVNKKCPIVRAKGFGTRKFKLRKRDRD